MEKFRNRELRHHMPQVKDLVETL